MSQWLDTYLKNLKKSGLERKIPNISEENALFIKNILQEKGPKHLLEIGTANGYSTLEFISVLPTESHITTIEYAWNTHIEAVENFKNCKIKNIHAIWGDAKEVIPSLSEKYFDFLYIDAMKREYLQYLILSIPKLTDEATIIIDDVEKFRDKMENLYAFLDERGITYTLEKTDVDDSIMILNRSSFVGIELNPSWPL